jgi:hypothetical protein
LYPREILDENALRYSESVGDTGKEDVVVLASAAQGYVFGMVRIIV